ncbi:Photosystem II 12 kDa extrinsic protein, chloroplastic [Symbiodinium microadriaticum]|uniref:Photosystem II 12 kDa extrinsic protein n=1 Tax=Symbiodinium microadriaticum TaxID=2951 RepID=A0A1Q9DXN3_SYMMI|nr:Photosystem II 12 kDa extrinsic protein, chloroplastic [Symbiodinium microadriaticum]
MRRHQGVPRVGDKDPGIFGPSGPWRPRAMTLAACLLAAALGLAEAYVPTSSLGHVRDRDFGQVPERPVFDEEPLDTEAPSVSAGLAAVATAFSVGSAAGFLSRRRWLAATSAAVALPSQVRAYGRSEQRTELTKVDINNASVREYQQFKGLFPAGAAVISGNGPYKSVQDVYNLPGIRDDDTMKAIVKKYEPYFECKTYDPALSKETRILYKQK